MKASVVIPCKGRVELLNRLIDSIINSKNSRLCEIVVVDDCSEPKIQTKKLRKQDKLIRLEESSGAAVARNIGIRNSIGEVIFLSDSDDIVIERDFDLDSDFAILNKCLCYSDVQSQGYKSNFPKEVTKDDFFSNVLVRNQFICQTSSLFFPRELNLQFDESLPKHQDWDFVYSEALLKGIKVKRAHGSIYFDRSDRNSLSRRRDSSLSIPWLLKMENENNYSDMSYLKYHLVGHYSDSMKLPLFIKLSVKYLITSRLKLISFIKKCYLRILY